MGGKEKLYRRVEKDCEGERKKKHIVGGEDMGKVYSNLVEVCR